MSDEGLSALDAEIRDLMRFAATRSILPRFRALEAGDIAMKGEDDPVTVVDREVEAFLTEALQKLAPGVPVVGEEAAHADSSVLEHLGEQCWIIDPLDGTYNFTHGKAPFGIIIALADAGEAVAGWIYDPQRERLCHAQKGKGAFIDGQPIQARSTGAEPPIAAISRLFLSEEEGKIVDARIAPHYSLVDIPRCAAEQYPRLALGENDISTFQRTLAWDHAAGALWLNEAGGRCARPDGSDYLLHDTQKPGLIGASSPAIWDAFAKAYLG